MVLNNIDYHIFDRCNLNCASCNHLSPLSKDSNIITIAKAREDFSILSQINDKFDKITILGGEPCLNPNLLPIIKLALEYFPGKVKLITNGTIMEPLYELKESVGDAVELVITEYPFNNNFREYYDKLKEDFPNAIFYTFRHEHGFISEHLSYDTLDTKDSVLLSCDKRFKCSQYINGRLYICHYAAFINNLKYITDFSFTNEDCYIDLTTATDQEFNDFFTTTIPEICRHCKYVCKSYEELKKSPWKKTDKKSSEWIS